MSRSTAGPLARALAANLRELRAERGLSQEELGRQIGVHRTRIGMYEQARGNPTLGSVERLAALLGVSSADLLLGRAEEQDEGR